MRDAEGYYREAGQSIHPICSSSLEGELQALLMATQHMWIRGYRKVIFEGENKSVHDLVNGKKKVFAVHNWIREINLWKQKFDFVEIK